MMGATLRVVIASQLPRVYGSIAQVAAVVPIYVAFLVAMPLLARLAAGLVGMDAREARALAFVSVTRNSLVVLPHEGGEVHESYRRRNFPGKSGHLSVDAGRFAGARKKAHLGLFVVLLC